jgi:hypothetical protein
MFMIGFILFHSPIMNEVQAFVRLTTVRNTVLLQTHLVLEEARYIKNRPHQLNYQAVLAQGLPIGSGEIESAH